MNDHGKLPGDDTIALAGAAAEAIRQLNHATLSGGGLGQPSAAYDVLGSLSAAAARLGQALRQITSYLDQALAAGLLGHDRGENPAHAVAVAGAFLDDARLSAAALAGDLDAAREQIALINGSPARHRNPGDQP